MNILAPSNPAFGLSEDELTERHASIPLADQVARQLEINVAAGIVGLVVPPDGLDRIAALGIGAAA